MIHFLKNNLLWTQGTWIAIITVTLGLISYIFFPLLLLIIIPFFIFCLYFFRNPVRMCPEALHDLRIIISPSDGKVVEIKKLDGDEFAYRVSIFLSPLDVHVNWVPLSGVVQSVIYKPGKFLVAYAPKSSEINERNDLIMQTKYGRIIVRQIAGMVARRICCWVHAGDSLKAGDTFGMIRFGSRVDLFLQAPVTLDVKVGDRVYGGQTILGRCVWE